MTRKKTLTKKEKLYALIGAGIILLVLTILIITAYNNLFNNTTDRSGRIQMELDDKKIESGEETKLSVTIQNTGTQLMEGELIIKTDDPNAVNVTHQDPSVMNIKLYEGESITRIFNVKGTTNAIRTDYKIIAEIQKNNETLSSNELILTVINE